jgi:small-conductance mechanosensitive channel
VLIFLIIGAGVEWLYWRYAAALRQRIELGALEGVPSGLAGTALRAALAMLGIALFAIGTLGAFVSFDWAPFIEVLVLSLLLAVVAIRVVNSLVVLVLCPRVARLRPVPISTPIARFAYRWLMTIVTIGVLGGLTAVAIEELESLPLLAVLVSSATATLVALLATVAVWRSRGLAAAARRSALSRPGLTADVMPVLATFLVGLGWLLWVAGATGLFWTLVLLVALPLGDRASRAVVRASISRSEPARTTRAGESTATVEAYSEAPGVTGTLPSRGRRGAAYGPALERFVRFVLVIAAVVLASAAWGFDLWAMSESTTFAGRVLEAGIDILVAYLIADLAWVSARTAIDARLADFEPPEPGHAPGPEARLATLLPLVRKGLMVTLIVMVVLIGLSSLGVNVGPLIAGAGVVGIAVGFGAQTLVRDIVSGVFFLLDDAFRVGEYIEIGDLRGTVESISVRSIRLRHHRGAVHTVPFGEMKSLTNHSRDWVIMKLEFRVPFDTDLNLVKRLVKRIGQDLAEHPDLGKYIIEPLKSQGVRRMEEFNMVVGVKFMAKPGEQWTIRKETYQRVRDAFEANGIGFAERNVKVEVVGADPSSAEAREAALGAAQDVIEQRLEPPPGTVGSAAE